MAVQAVAPVVPLVFWPPGHEKHEEAPELGAYVLMEHAAQLDEPDQPHEPVERDGLAARRLDPQPEAVEVRQPR